MRRFRRNSAAKGDIGADVEYDAGMEGIDLTSLDMGSPDGTSETFVAATFVGHLPGGVEEEWILRTYSGWTIKLSDVERRHPAIGAKIRAKIIEGSRSL
jgi:hypothetical protein